MDGGTITWESTCTAIGNIPTSFGQRAAGFSTDGYIEDARKCTAEREPTSSLSSMRGPSNAWLAYKPRCDETKPKARFVLLGQWRLEVDAKMK